MSYDIVPPSGIGISGTNVNRNVIFAKRNHRSKIDLNFTINDDKVSLENDEVYLLNLSNPDSDPRVVLTPTTITIQDNDGTLYYCS